MIKQINPIDIVLIFFEIAALCYNTEMFRNLGYFLIILGTILLIILIIKNNTIKLNKKTFIYMFGVLMAFGYGFLRLPTRYGLNNFFSVSISMIVLVCFSCIDITKINEKLQEKIIAIQIIIFLIPCFLGTGVSPIDGGYMAIFSTTTFLGIFSCLSIEICYLSFEISRKKIWVLYSIFFLYFIVRSKVRTAMVGIIIIAILVGIMNLIKNIFCKRYFLKIMTCCCFVLLIAIVVVYPQLDKFSWFPELNAFVYNYTGKVLLSGRNILWKNALSLISRKPFMGYGLDYNSVLNQGISVHNSYLHILLQSGIIGIITVLLLLNSIMKRITNRKNNWSFIIAIFSLVNFIMCSTEVMLFQGQIILQIIIWSILGIGLNNYMIIVRQKRNEKK